MSRESIIEAVKTPLGFFVLTMLVLETGLLGSMGLTPQELHDDTLYIFGGILVLLIFSVIYITKNTTTGTDVDTLGYSLGAEIFYSFDPYISNLSDNEREEAYQSLLAQMRAPSDTKNKMIRAKIAEVISEKSGITIGST
ncbi:MAG: hypothetical protein P8X63_09945 [Desulfuromonadaceae bacterium]|jgi:hypothetical protein